MRTSGCSAGETMYNLKVIMTMKRITCTLAALFSLLAAAHAADLRSGTWVLNVAKSTDIDKHGIHLLRSGTIVTTLEGAWIIHRSHNVDKDGNLSDSNMIGTNDGKPVPLVGATGGGYLRTITILDDFRAKGVYAEITGKSRLTIMQVISPDGKTMTNTTTGIDKEGKPVSYFRVYDKQ